MQRSNASASLVLTVACPASASANDHPLVPGKIADALDPGKACAGEQSLDRVRLIEPHLERHRRYARDHRRQPSNLREPVASGQQRRAWLVTGDLGRQLRALLDVWQVCEHRIEALVDAFEQIRADERY